MDALEQVARELPVVFPVHPRTRKMLGDRDRGAVTLTDPIGYLDFLSLEADAAAVLTDSGGIQEETTYLGVPCFTLRDNTERPVTVRAGTNTLLGLAPERITEIPALLAAELARESAATGEMGWTSGTARRRRARRLVASPTCRSPRWYRGTASSSTCSTRPARTRCAARACSRRCSSSGPTSAASPARSCSPSRRATGSPTTSSSGSTRPSSRRSTARTSTAWRRKLDDIVDYIEETADFMGLYRIEAPMEQSLAMADVLVKSCEQLAAALEHLRGFKDLDRYWIEIHRLENDGDRLYRDAVASLFANGIDPMFVIRWRDIFLRLERAVDATETAAHILEGIVIKNA